MKKILSCFLLLVLMLTAGCHSKSSRSFSKSGIFFDTAVTLTIFSNNDSALKDAFKILEKYDRLFSKNNIDSDVYRINSANGKPTEVDPETSNILKKAKYFSVISEGKFDVTVAPLTALWNFKAENARVPSDKEIKNAKDKVSFENILIDNNTITLLNGATVDLGGIAKGYIADRLKEFFEERQDISGGVINLGGNVVVFGEKADLSDFSVGIKKPFSKIDEIAATIFLKGGSVVTSGSYERYFEINNNIYHHILDTVSGSPARTGLSSVTVISESSLDGDALSTAFFALGKEKSLKLIETLEGVDAVFIDETGEISVSEGLSISKDGDKISININ